MNDLNTIVIEGKLTHDPKITMVTADSAVCRFSIAVNRRYMDRKKQEFIENVSFFTVETWGKVAENCAKWLSKGRGVRVVGHLKQHRWTENRPESYPRERVYILSEHIEFQPLKNKTQSGEPNIIRPENDDNSIETLEAQSMLDRDIEIEEEKQTAV